jgi:ubiquinone/menaquinone biosynthesis C-methylase UbiE
MASPEHTIDANSPPDAPPHRPDSVGPRSKSIGDLRSVYAEKADAAARFDFLDRLTVGRYRADRFGDVQGRVLDVACGTGSNFPHLPETVDLVGVDISPEMLEKAESRLADLPLSGTLEEQDAQDLEFEDDSFDAVISSLSTCTFPDPIAALEEMERVVDPDGTIRLIEHGRSSYRPIAWVQEWRADAHYAKTGCRWTQEPREVIDEAGLTVSDTATGFLGMITTFEIDPQSRE